MTKNKNKKSSEAAKQEAFKLSEGICCCKTPAFLDFEVTTLIEKYLLLYILQYIAIKYNI